MESSMKELIADGVSPVICGELSGRVLDQVDGQLSSKERTVPDSDSDQTDENCHQNHNHLYGRFLYGTSF